MKSEEDEKIVNLVISGAIPSYSLESSIGGCRRAAGIRREAVERKTGKSLAGLPLDGFDYESILGQCCEMPIVYVQLPVGIAGPLLLNGSEYMVPMATSAKKYDEINAAPEERARGITINTASQISSSPSRLR